MNTQLQVIIQQNGLEASDGQTLLEKFGSYEAVASEWEAKAKAIVVTDASQTTEIEMAKVAAKKFADMRIELEKARKGLKEQSLRKGQAIDAVAKYIQSLISPIELHLKAQADFVKIQEAKIAEEKRIAEEKKLEEERQAKLEADRKEQERVRLENETLRKQMEEKDKAARLEKEEADRKIREEQAKANQERADAQKKLDEERAAAEKKLADQKAEADRKQKELEDKLARTITCPNCNHQFELKK